MNSKFIKAILITLIYCASIKPVALEKKYYLTRRYIKSDVALINSIDQNKIEDIKKLIKNGASINTRDKNGATPLLRAIRYKNFEVIKLLLENDADPNLCGASPFYSDQQTPLTEAILDNDIEITRILLEYGAVPDKCFFPPLFIASWATGQAYRETLYHRANFQQKDKKYYEKLFDKISQAVYKTKEILQLLVDCGNDLNTLEGMMIEQEFELITEKYGVTLEGTPLMFSILHKTQILCYMFSMIEYLQKTNKVSDLQKIINFTNQAKLALNQKIEIIAKSCSDINTSNRRGETALDVAFGNIDVEAIKILICNGVNIDTKIDKKSEAILEDLTKDLESVENLTAHKINTRITKKNLEEFISHYSTNSYDTPINLFGVNDYHDTLNNHTHTKDLLTKDCSFPEPIMGM